MEDDDAEDDDEEDAMGMFQYGFRGGRKTAEGLFPAATSPDEAGVELERKGLFGRVRLCGDCAGLAMQGLIEYPHSLGFVTILHLESGSVPTAPISMIRFVRANIDRHSVRLRDSIWATPAFQTVLVQRLPSTMPIYTVGNILKMGHFSILVLKVRHYRCC